MADGNAVLNSKVSALEDELRIIKGEVKQVLTEIRSAILVQDSPFDETPAARSRPVQIIPAMEPTRVEIVMPHEVEAPPKVVAATAPAAAVEPPALHLVPPSGAPAQPIVHDGAAHTQATHAVAPAPVAPPPHQPRWSLLTIANLAGWAEEAIQKVGPKRLSILLDLCEVSGYLSPEARLALSGVSELDVPNPTHPASPMDVTVLLRQLDALLQGEPTEPGPRLLY